MMKSSKKNRDKLTIKVTSRGTFKIPSTIQKLHGIECLEVEFQEEKIILKQVKENEV